MNYSFHLIMNPSSEIKEKDLVSLFLLLLLKKQGDEIIILSFV